EGRKGARKESFLRRAFDNVAGIALFEGMSTSPSSASESGFELRTHFVRGRNALVARGDFGEIYVDYYLHLADHGLRVEPAHDALFKRALAAFGLHCVARPWGDLTAWTINFQQPLVNLFLTGDNQDG